MLKIIEKQNINMNNKKTSKIAGWLRVFLFIIPYIIIVGLFELLGGLIADIDFKNSQNRSSFQRLITYFFNLTGTFFTLWIFMKFVDKEPFIKLGFQTKNRLKDFIVGNTIGLMIMFVGFVSLFLLNEITILGINFNFKELVVLILLFIIVAVVEEVLFRGYILKNLMLSMNKYVALIISSILFSLAHGANPHMSFFTFADLFLAGITLGISYLYTKNLWFPIAFHLSWNLFQSLFGFNVSGQDFYSLINFNIAQNNAINGGDFGFEGSYLSIIAEILTFICIVIYYEKQKNKISHS